MIVAFVLCAWEASASASIDIDTVSVGDPGNAPDTRYNIRSPGGVDYAYSIGKYEVTAAQYTAFLNAVGGVDTYGLYTTDMWSRPYGSKIERYAGSGVTEDPYQYRVAPEWANRPVNLVSYWDACRFSNWMHNNQPIGVQGPGTTETGAYTLNGYVGDDGRAIQRNANAIWAVTSEDEWYKAAYYKGGSINAGYWDYPTSSDDINTSMANYYPSVGHTTEVGSYPYVSPYGTFDQGGNVWEWNEAIPYPHASFAYRDRRGGSYGGIASYLHASNDDSHYPDFESGDLGFRISLVPEPAGMALLAFGGLLIVRRRSAFIVRSRSN